MLAHTSGYAGWTESLDAAGLMDLPYAEGLLAAQDPWWEPGTASGYHMLSHGHLLDGIVRGATGSTLAEQFRELVAEPLGADFHLGVPDDALDRCADLIAPPPGSIDISALPEGNLLVPTLANPFLDVGGFCNTPPWRQVSVAAANGHGNARSIAQIQSVVSHGGGSTSLSPATVDRIFEVQADGPDLVLLVPLRWGIGYALPTPTAPAVPDGRVCWWTGYGGSIVVNDLDRRTTVAYAMNRMVMHFTSSPRTDGYLRTAFACLEEAPVMTKVCIIGAGCSGITTAKRLQDHGIDYDQFELSDDVGGNWYFRNPNGRSSVYESLHIDTSTSRLEFEDFPAPADYPALPAPHPDPPVLPRLRRPLRPARRDHLRSRRRPGPPYL